VPLPDLPHKWELIRWDTFTAAGYEWRFDFFIPTLGYWEPILTTTVSTDDRLDIRLRRRALHEGTEVSLVLGGRAFGRYTEFSKMPALVRPAVEAAFVALAEMTAKAIAERQP
jgi:hypothetical protein